MSSALNQVAVEIQKSVRNPVERTTGMRAAVMVADYAGGCTHQKNIFRAAWSRNTESATSANRKLIELTEFEFQGHSVLGFGDSEYP